MKEAAKKFWRNVTKTGWVGLDENFPKGAFRVGPLAAPPARTVRCDGSDYEVAVANMADAPVLFVGTPDAIHADLDAIGCGHLKEKVPAGKASVTVALPCLRHVLVDVTSEVSKAQEALLADPESAKALGAAQTELAEAKKRIVELETELKAVTEERNVLKRDKRIKNAAAE